MAKPNRREQVSCLIIKTRNAARRPLFSEIVLVERRRKQHQQRQHQSRDLSKSACCHPHSNQKSSLEQTQDIEDLESEHQTWEELLCRASQLVPFMTTQEHSEFLQLASIFLLGYLLPYSTGNEWYLLQSAPNAFMPDFDLVEYILTMPLEDRMSKSIRRYTANKHGEINTLADASLEISFESFLQHGLAPLLSKRDVSREKTDLLHVIALAICPLCSSPTLPPATIQRLDKQNHPYWQRTKRFIRDHLSASQFCLGYGSRLKLIRIVTENVNIPVPLDEHSSDVVAPLLFGAIPHLRSSLNGFAKGWALSGADADAAWAAEAKLACCEERVLAEEWDFLLHRMCEDAPCNCAGLTKDCRYARLERRLSSLLISSGKSKSRINPHACSSLADAVEWQLDLWTQDDDAVDDDSRTEVATQKMDIESQASPDIVPCLMSSLLSCATSCLRMFARLQAQEDATGQDDDPIITLVRASIDLLHHPDKRIAAAAVSLLEAALSRMAVGDEILVQLFNSTTLIILEAKQDCLRWKGMIGLAAKRSRAFAQSLLSCLLKHLDDLNVDDKLYSSTCSLIAHTSISCPLAASSKSDTLIRLLNHDIPCNLDMVASLVSLRQARYFASTPTNAELAVAQFLVEKSLDPWAKYRIARHAMLSGNLSMASNIYNQLCGCPVSETYFLWLSVLQNISNAESRLNQMASKGIPEATVSLQSAMRMLEALEESAADSNESFAYQLSFLHLRLEFLDMLVVLRHLAWEVRLTGRHDNRCTRAQIHEKGVIRGFIDLARQYRNLLQCFGAEGSTDQFRMAIGVLEHLCLLFARAAKSVFPEYHPPPMIMPRIPEGWAAPMAFLMRTCNVVVDEMVSVDAVVRAQTLLEVMDGVLMTPIPLPVNLFAPLHRTRVKLMLSANADDNDELGDLESIDSSPSLSFSFTCSGSIPKRLISRPAVRLLLWYRIRYVRELDDDDIGAMGEDDNEEAVPRQTIIRRLPDVAPYLPVEGPILSGGDFHFSVLCPPLPDEGMFRIEARLGYCDRASNQWKLDSAVGSIGVRVSRSRSLL